MLQRHVLPKPLSPRKLMPSLLVAIFLQFSFNSIALTILSGPFFTTNTNAPLAGALQLTTDEYSRVSVSVSDGEGTWERDFYDYDTNHSVPLLGFQAGQSNVITVTVHDLFGNEAAASKPVVFVTKPLPTSFPLCKVWTSEPEKMEPGYTLVRIINENLGNGYMTVLDNSGNIVWYSGVPAQLDVRQLENGDLFIPEVTNFTEINMLGDTVHNWNVPNMLTIDFHDGVPTDHGTILYLNDQSKVVTNFPSSATNPNAPLQKTSVEYEQVVEISATNGALLNAWSLIDMLDPTRIDYLTFSSHTTLGWDCEHANAVIEDPRDNSIIVSMRHQDAVIKFSRVTGQLKWILGDHLNWDPAWQKYLLKPIGTPFQWQYGQHAPFITSRGTLMLYDDGNFRASPFNPPVADSNNYSRAVEYDINEQTMEVSQVWDYGRTNADRLYTDRVGSARQLPQTQNVLINYGYVLYENGVYPNPHSPAAVMARIKEVTYDPSPQVVFDFAFFDYSNTSSSYKGSGDYRAYRIPDLYPVRTPSRAVADLITAAGNSGSRITKSLIANLTAAVISIGEHKPADAIQQLHTFQLLAGMGFLRNLFRRRKRLLTL